MEDFHNHWSRTLDRVDIQQIQAQHDFVHGSRHFDAALRAQFFENKPDYSCPRCYPVQGPLRTATREFLELWDTDLEFYSNQTEPNFRGLCAANTQDDHRTYLLLTYQSLRFTRAISLEEFAQRLRDYQLDTSATTTDEEVVDTEPEEEEEFQEADLPSDQESLVAEEEDNPTINLATVMA